jgi:pyruvate formate lyase activating enzyme
MKELGLWVEITTLVIPGFNDSEDEFLKIARFIASVDPAMPWHISRFHPDYQFTKSAPTTLKILEQARDIGLCEGLHHVYIGNVAGVEEITLCANCHESLIKREAFLIKENALKGGQCPYCGTDVAGIFGGTAPSEKMIVKKRGFEKNWQTGMSLAGYSH